MPWFIKQETFLRPASELAPHLQAHRLWVAQQRAAGRRLSSGYLVDADDRPGGGGLLLLEAADHADALRLIQEDPMLRSGLVRWSLHRWIGVVGDLDSA
ncbi:MAG: YciI family protein [Synechococcaceae cyanobacterium]|nr:YciI family protein [Synechococcaceae cyanobacterium]